MDRFASQLNLHLEATVKQIQCLFNLKVYRCILGYGLWSEFKFYNNIEIILKNNRKMEFK